MASKLRKVIGIGAGVLTFGCLISYQFIGLKSFDRIREFAATPTPTDIILSIDPTQFAQTYGTLYPNLYGRKEKADLILTPISELVANNLESSISPSHTELPNPTPSPAAQSTIDPRFTNHNWDKTLLSDSIPLEVRLEDVELSAWEISTMQHLIPIAATIEDAAHYYGLDQVFMVQIGIQESSLYPLATSSTNDYGLFQLKAATIPKYFNGLAKDPTSEFYAPFIEDNPLLVDNYKVFDPTINTWVHAMVMKNQWDNVVIHTDSVPGGLRLTNNQQMYAYYSRGYHGINPDGTLTEIGKIVASSVDYRYTYINRVLPLLGLTKEDIEKIPDSHTRDNLMNFVDESTGKISLPIDPEVGYQKIIEFNIDYLDRRVFSSSPGNVRDALYYGATVQFTEVMDDIYGYDQQEEYQHLLDLGLKMYRTIEPGPSDTRDLLQKYIDHVQKRLGQ